MITQEEQALFDSFWLQVGDRVELTKDPGIKGTVISIDFFTTSFFEYGTTTCEVLWDGETSTDTQWDNKLSKVQGDYMKFSIGGIQVKDCVGGQTISVPYTTDLGNINYVTIEVNSQGINVYATITLNEAGQKALQDCLHLARLLQKYSKVEYVSSSFPPLQPEPDIEIDADDEVNLDPTTINRPLG